MNSVCALNPWSRTYVHSVRLLPMHVLLRRCSEFYQRSFPIVVSIETLLDINSLTIENLVSRLKPSEDRVTIDSVTEQTGRLMLAEELWLSKYRHRLNSESSSSSGGGDKASLFNSGKQKAGGHNVKKDPGSS
jgi:hypothetical protein